VTAAAADLALDTVQRAAATPDQVQPYAELGLRDDEYARIREILGRRPTEAELAMYSVMWSEHCSYKSSKVHLAYFGETTTEAMRRRMLAGIGENAGVVDIGDGWAATFKIESHNHPSYVEPYQGAATGVGGIVRDILAMGARPLAVTDQLRFGPADAADSARVVPGVVAGISGYGNCLGLANIGGETVFDPSYAGNPLVNAGCIGVLRAADMYTAHASGLGNKVILYGSRTGRDGIGGVSVLASATFDDDVRGFDTAFSGPDGEKGSIKPAKPGGTAARAKLPSVQVGDPFAEKVLIEGTLELFTAGLVEGIQDLGGAGLSCATSELASAGDGGMAIDLDAVPLRAEGMSAAEILSSESQERMCAVVQPRHVDAFLAVCRRWEVPAVVIGEVTDGGRLVISHRGQVVVDVPPRTVAHEGPVYRRPIQRPATQDALQADTSARLPRPSAGDLGPLIVRMAGSQNLCSRAWITDQYDRYVRGNTVLAQPADAGLVRVSDDSWLGLAMASDCNGRYTALDPYAGAQLALAEAYRNVVTCGATPVAVTDCLNFGSPEDPGVMWQFQQAVQGLADGCVELGIPVTGGNVSFYNQTGSDAILPTPVVGVLGVLDDVRTRIGPSFGGAGTEPDPTLVLLGTTREELDGSEWARGVHGHLGGRPPAVDLAAERRLGEVMSQAARARLVSAAHDLSEGGLAQALVEMCLISRSGAVVTLPDGVDPFVQLFSESAARVLVAVPPAALGEFTALCDRLSQPWLVLGEGRRDGRHLDIDGVARLALPELRTAWEGTLPALIG
jgi:phosphoribosylformylglycinamidine synthase